MGEKAYGCFRCKEATDVGVIICPKCADELAALNGWKPRKDGE
jgi:RNA polymerase subunit RPABC4/transcription elongation factor Spt4